MKRLCYLVLSLLWMMPSVSFAQEDLGQEQAEKEKIKEIKLSENYVFATAVTEEDLTEAQQNSMDLLRANVNAIFAERFHMEKEDVEEIWDVIEDKCQNVTIRKGDLFRVFSYILKDYLFPGKKKKKNKVDSSSSSDESEEIQTVDIERVSEAVANETLPQDAQDRIMDFVPSKGEQTRVNSLPVELPSTDLSVPVPVVVVQPVEPVEEPVVVRVSKPKENISADEIKEEPAVVTPDLDPILEELLLVQTFKDLVAILDQRKDEGVLMYGSIKTMLSPEKCYLAIFKDGEMVTFLDKGDKERINLKTHGPDSLSNYKGYGAIWIQLFKSN